VRFIVGEDASIFNCVARIYTEAKVMHGMVGAMPVILPQDETKVKNRITWEPQSDVLAGFYGSKHFHACITNFKRVVESGKQRYE
jgi:hypothetical protein